MRETFERRGYLAPVPILDPQEAAYFYQSAAEADPANPHLSHPELEKLAKHPQLTAIAHELLGDEITLFRVSLKNPEPGRGVPWHQDSHYWTEIEPEAKILSVWLALEDATPDNGCLIVAPGSHLVSWTYEAADPATRTQPEQAVYCGPEQLCPVKAGEAILFDYHLLHRSGANPEGPSRLAAVFRFAEAAAELGQNPRMEFHR